MRHTLVLTSLLVLLLSNMGRANAQLTFTLSPDTLTGAPGDTLMFFGTVTNSGSTTVFVNTDNVNLTGMGLTLDDNPFFMNVPQILNAGDTSGRVELFDVAIDPTAAFSMYPGFFSVVGGATNGSQDLLATSNFTVIVAPAAPPPAPNVPEPGSIAIMGMGCGVLGVGFASRKRARNAR